MEILGQNLCWYKLVQLCYFKSSYHSDTVKKGLIFSFVVLPLIFFRYQYVTLKKIFHVRLTPKLWQRPQTQKFQIHDKCKPLPECPRWMGTLPCELAYWSTTGPKSCILKPVQVTLDPFLVAQSFPYTGFTKTTYTDLFWSSFRCTLRGKSKGPDLTHSHTILTPFTKYHQLCGQDAQ